MGKRNKLKKMRKKSKKVIAFFVILFIILVVSFFLDKTGVWDTANNAVDSAFSEKVDTDNDSEDIILTARFIDVGQGDCSLLISDGKTMLTDCGESEYSDKVIAALHEYGVTELDYVVATHTHSDHLGGMPDVLAAFPAKNIIISEPSEKSSQTSVYENFIDALELSDADIIVAEPCMTFSLGEATCEIIAPYEISQSEENDNSVVMTVTAGETVFLLTGDAEKTVEKQILKNRPELDIDILKAGHHGSKSSSSEAFLSAVSPDCAIISVGSDNRYGHPSDETLKTFESMNINYFRTDICGTVTVNCTAKSYDISTEK